MDENRAQTGIAGLDKNIQGGFPKGSMILVAGNPGTGKTMFSGQFLYHGAAECSENGFYVSFSEGRATFLDNMSKFGLDFHELEKQGKFEVLDLITVKEPGIDPLMEMITTRIDATGAERLVVDSFTAMANAFSTVIDARVTLHLLSKIVRQTGCTTLLVTEIPTGLDTIGMGIEEFVVDGIIILARQLVDGYTVRKLEIAKIRGTKIEEPRMIFTLHDDFKVFTPLKFDAVQKPQPFNPTPNPPDRFSTGHRQLDEILGGFRRGDTILVELGEDIAPFIPALLFGPLRMNFISNGMGVIFLPPEGESVDRIIRFGQRYGIDEEAHKRLMRIAISENQDKREPYTFILPPHDLKRSLEVWEELKKQMKEETGKPVFKMVYIEAFNVFLSLNQSRLVIAREITNTKNEGGLMLLFSKPGVEELTQYVTNMSNLHLRLFNEQGVTLFHGIRPRTPIYALEMSETEEYPRLKLTPLV